MGLKASLQGKIEKVLELREGVSKTGKPWSSQDYVLMVDQGRYSSRLVFGLFGDNVTKYDLKVDDEIEIKVWIESRAYTNKEGKTAYITQAQADEVTILRRGLSAYTLPNHSAGGYVATPAQPTRADDLPF